MESQDTLQRGTIRRRGRGKLELSNYYKIIPIINIFSVRTKDNTSYVDNWLVNFYFSKTNSLYVVLERSSTPSPSVIIPSFMGRFVNDETFLSLPIQNLLKYHSSETYSKSRVNCEAQRQRLILYGFIQVSLNGVRAASASRVQKLKTLLKRKKIRKFLHFTSFAKERLINSHQRL